MLTIDNISFSYGSSAGIANVGFSCPKGSHTAIIGESGSGKSTLLKLLYGQYDLNSGSIQLNGKLILGPKYNLVPGDKTIKYLSQDFGLMPYITAAENVGKFLSNVDKEKKRARVNELLEMVGMLAFADVKPQFLSGGQQQRIALAKVLALEPEVLLLDEPFSQIDTFRANALRRDLFGYLKEKDITCLIATHDAADVLAYADEVIVMQNGSVVAQGSPDSVYRNPVSHYVASLFDEVNQIPSWYFSDVDGDQMLLVYPHQLKIVQTGIQVIVLQNYFRGSHYLIEAAYQEGKILFNCDVRLPLGTHVMLTLEKQKAS